MWVCERCTLNNIERKKRCDACGGRRRIDGSVSRGKANRSSSSPILNNHEHKRLKNDDNNDIAAKESHCENIQLPNIECNNDTVPLVDKTNSSLNGRTKNASKQNGMKSDETNKNRIISNDMDVCARINKCQDEVSSNDMNLMTLSTNNNTISKRKRKASKISQKQHSVNDNMESQTTTWNCIACTYANKITHRRCHVCSTRRCDDHYTFSEAPSSSSSSISSPPPQELVSKSRPGTERHLTRKRKVQYQSNHLYEGQVHLQCDSSLPPTECDNINNRSPLVALLPTQHSLGTSNDNEKNTKKDIRLRLNITGCHEKYEMLLAVIEMNPKTEDENPLTADRSVNDNCFDTESLRELENDDKQDQNNQTEFSILLDSTVNDSSNCLKQKDYIQHDDHRHESISDRITEQYQSQECIDYAISEEPPLHEIHNEPIIQISSKDMLISNSGCDYSHNKKIIESLVDHAASGDDHNECDKVFCSDNSRSAKGSPASFDDVHDTFVSQLLDSSKVQKYLETIADVDNNHESLVDNPLSAEDCNDCDDTVCCDNSKAATESPTYFVDVHDTFVSQLLDSTKIQQNVETISERDVGNIHESLVDNTLSAEDCNDCDDTVCCDNSKAATESPTSFVDVHDTFVSQLLDSTKIQQNVLTISERDVGNNHESLVDNPLSAEDCNDCDDTVCCDDSRAVKEIPTSFVDVHTSVSQLLDSSKIQQNVETVNESLVDNPLSAEDCNDCDDTVFCDNSRAAKGGPTSFDDVHDTCVSQLLDSSKIQQNVETIFERDVDNNHESLVDNPPYAEGYRYCDNASSDDYSRAAKEIPTSFDDRPDASVSQLLESSRIQNLKTKSEKLSINSLDSTKQGRSVAVQDTSNSIARDDLERSCRVECNNAFPTCFDDVHDIFVSQLLDSSKIQNVKTIYERDVDNNYTSVVDNPPSAERYSDFDDTASGDDSRAAKAKSEKLDINSLDSMKQDQSVTVHSTSNNIARDDFENSSRDESSPTFVSSFSKCQSDFYAQFTQSQDFEDQNQENIEIHFFNQILNETPFDENLDSLVSQNPLSLATKFAEEGDNVSRHRKVEYAVQLGSKMRAENAETYGLPSPLEGASESKPMDHAMHCRSISSRILSSIDTNMQPVCSCIDSESKYSSGSICKKFDKREYLFPSISDDATYLIGDTTPPKTRITSSSTSTRVLPETAGVVCKTWLTTSASIQVSETSFSMLSKPTLQSPNDVGLDKIIVDRQREESAVSDCDITCKDCDHVDFCAKHLVQTQRDHHNRNICYTSRSETCLGYPNVRTVNIDSVSFKTAGSENVIIVSEQGMANASRIIGLCDSIDIEQTPRDRDSDARCQFAATASVEQQNINRICVEKAPKLLSDRYHQPVTDSIWPHSSSSGPPSLANFKSAGSNKIVQISEQSMADASRILGVSVPDDKGKPEKTQVSGFSSSLPAVISTESVDQNVYENRNVLETFSHQQLRCDTRSNITDQVFLGQIPECNEHGKTSKLCTWGVVERETYGTARSSATETRSSLSVRDSAEWLGKDSSHFLCEETVTTTANQHCPRTKVAEIPVESWSTPMVPAFKFAGSDRIVQVSEKGIASASRILGIIDADDTGIVSRNLPVFCKDPAQLQTPISMGLACHYSRDVFGDKNSESHMDQQIHPDGRFNHEFVSFRTAGSEKAIQVSEQGMSNASRIMSLSDSSDKEISQRHRNSDACRQCAGTTSIEHQDTYKTCFEKLPELLSGQCHHPVTDSVLSHSSSAPPFLANFKSAGSNKMVQISERSMVHASRIMGTFEDDDENKPEKNQVSSVSSRCPAVTSTGQVFCSRILDCNKHVKTSTPCSSIGGVRETYETARSAANTRSSHSAQDLAKWFGKDSSHFLCDESVKTISYQNFSATEAADLPVESWSTPMVPVFKCAGSDRMVQVSEKGLARASRILSIIDAEDPRDVSKNLAFIDRDRFSVEPSCHFSRDDFCVSKVAESHFDQQIHSVATLPSSKSLKYTELDETMQVPENRLIKESTILGMRDFSVQKAVSQKNCSRSPISESNTELSTCKTLDTTPASFTSNLSFLPPVLASFKSAASDKVIHISEKNLMNAMKILGDDDAGTNITDRTRVGDTHRRCCMSTERGSQFDVDKAAKEVAVPPIDRQPQSVSQCLLPILPCVTPTFASFKSPGSGSDNKIVITHQFKSNDSGIQDFSVSRYHEIGDNNRASGAHMHVMTSQSSDRSVNEVSSEKDLPSESNQHPYQVFESLSSYSSCRAPSSASFKFVGADAIINLSEQGLANDSRILDVADSHVNETADTNHNNDSRMQYPALVSYETISSLGVSGKPDIKACFDQQPLPSLFAAFQCAGSHKVIHVSEDSMKNVARILEETDLDVKEPFDRNLSLNSYKRSPFLSIDHTKDTDPNECFEKSTRPSSCQQSIPPEESNLPISSWPTPMVATFKSAGSDNMIKVSELSLTNASNILGFDHSDHADLRERCKTDGDSTQAAGVATDPIYQDNLIVTCKTYINTSIALENNAAVFQSTVVQPPKTAKTLPEFCNGSPSSILDGNSAMMNKIKGHAGYSPSSGSMHSPSCGSRAAMSEDFARCCNSVGCDVKIPALQADITRKMPGYSEEKNLLGYNELKLDEDTTDVVTVWQSPRRAPFDPYSFVMPSSAHVYNCYSSPCDLNGIGRDCVTESPANNVIVSITSESASRVIFDPISRKPNAIGSLADSLDNIKKIRSILCDSGCERHKLSDKWLLNHIRWVVWKLACIERYFASRMEENVLTIERVVRHLLHRYNKEYRNGARSPIRKMLNHDVSATRMIILCVARIESISNVADMRQNDSCCYLELTDGWYSIKALPDLKLCNIIKSGKIRVGTKLLLCNSRLDGDCDGIDPLDDAYDPSLEKGPALRIFANSTRVAKWNSKLDFIHPGVVPSSHEGKLLVRRLSDVFEDGGSIPLIRLRVRSVGNMMYLEKNHASSNEAQHHRILSEKEEICRLEFLEKEQQQLVEEYSEDVYRDCCEELDAEAPEEWNQMMIHESPEGYYEALETRQRKAIDGWREHRFNLLQTRIQKELASRLEESNANFQPSTPFLRIEVQDAFAVESSVEENNQVAMLTIWNPSQDQLALFDKDAVLQVKNLDLRGERFKGCLQLSANKKTEFSSFRENTCNTSLFRIQLQSKQIGYDHGKKLCNNLFNFTGIILHSGNTSKFLPPCLYATDESGLILRITFESKTLESRSFLDIFVADELTTQNPEFEILCFSSLQLRPFDYEANCCVAEYGPVSSVAKNAQTRRYLILKNYGGEPQGQRALRKLSNYIRFELPYFWRSNSRTVASVGYIVGFSVIPTNSTCVIVEVDCGGPFLHKWALPIELIGQLNSLLDESNINNAILAEHLATNLMSLGKLGHFLRVSQILLQFGLRILDSSFHYQPACSHEVTSIRRANQENISFLYSW